MVLPPDGIVLSPWSIQVCVGIARAYIKDCGQRQEMSMWTFLVFRYILGGSGFFVMVILFVCLNKTLLNGLLLTEVWSMFLPQSPLCTAKTHGGPLSHGSWLTAGKCFRALLKGEKLLFRAVISVLSLLWSRQKKQQVLPSHSLCQNYSEQPCSQWMHNSNKNVNVKV